MPGRDERVVLGVDRYERGEIEEINNQNPFPVQLRGPQIGDIPFNADISWRLAIEGRFFYASDADQNDYVTGQTSFANTTPTFLLENPAVGAATSTSTPKSGGRMRTPRAVRKRKLCAHVHVPGGALSANSGRTRLRRPVMALPLPT